MAVGPDYLQFKHAMETSRNDIIHSPKGTTWKDHKYVRKENGRYIYPASGTSGVSTAVNKLKDSVNDKIDEVKKKIDKKKLIKALDDYEDFYYDKDEKQLYKNDGRGSYRAVDIEDYYYGDPDKDGEKDLYEQRRGTYHRIKK